MYKIITYSFLVFCIFSLYSTDKFCIKEGIEKNFLFDLYSQDLSPRKYKNEPFYCTIKTKSGVLEIEVFYTSSEWLTQSVHKTVFNELLADAKHIHLQNDKHICDITIKRNDYSRSFPINMSVFTT